jgi:ElaB/YqjD/DUF883 family membrane-anchored ribosome-binding protein
MEQLRGDIGALSEAVKEAGREKGRAAINRARRSGEAALGEAQALRERADQEIEAHPLTSVLMSFGIGFLIGMLFDRRH